MKIINIIDSLEINGGSTMFLEMVAGMQKYWKDDEIHTYVVSKTGQFGRKGLVNSSFAPSYGVDLEVYDYANFEKKVAVDLRDAVIFHHVLGYTKNITFHQSCKYVVINHRDVNLRRLPSFNASAIVCVSQYFAQRTRKAKAGKPIVILNGCEDYCKIKPSVPSDKLVLGRCQRIVASKFLNERIKDKRVVQYVIGPVNFKNKHLLPRKCKSFGPVFDLDKKIPIIRSFDLYLHATSSVEGCSMSLLEAMSCAVPIVAKNIGGGVNEIIKPGVNGFLYRNTPELRKIILRLLDDRDYLGQIKESTYKYFLQKFHIKNMLDNYRKIFCECKDSSI